MMKEKYASFLLVFCLTNCIKCWELPNLPSGKRSQYYLLNNDGGYKYGFDTGKNYFAKQTADEKNEVEGHYAYKGPDGKDIDVKYTAGTQGFIPEGLDALLPKTKGPNPTSQRYNYNPPSSYSGDGYWSNQDNKGDASYSFAINTDNYKRQESSDPNGNIHGRYSYTNEAGNHDLTYVAGSNTGFVATSGSLSMPNGLEGRNIQIPSANYYSRYAPGMYNTNYQRSQNQPEANFHQVMINPDGSYYFEYTTGDQSRQESSDPSGNVQGRYAFTNQAGTHDLNYVAGSRTGFQPTGGSLASPARLEGRTNFFNPSSQNYFGTVPGRYGTHTGFLPTGGSLVPSNGVYGRTGYSQNNFGSFQGRYGNVNNPVVNPDGSYSFEYTTGDQSRQESSDSNGNVQGKYSFTNEAGMHDLSYVAGSQTGFQPIGGSLATPNGLQTKSYSSTPPRNYNLVPPIYTRTNTENSQYDNEDDQSNTGDSSYSFTIDTDEYKREESADPQGNVRGSFSYKNNAGTHDLSFIAGSELGFKPTGGSLSQANGLTGKRLEYNSPLNNNYNVDDDTTDPPIDDTFNDNLSIKSRFGSFQTDRSYYNGPKVGGPYSSPEYLPPQFSYKTGKTGSAVVKQYYPSKSQAKYGYIYES